MKLLFLIPNFVLLGISVYNMLNEFAHPAEPNYLIFKIVHIIVMLMSATFIAMIVKSMFEIKTFDAPEENEEAIITEPDRGEAYELT